MDLYGNFAAYCTGIRWYKSFKSTLSFLLCHFGTHFLERSAERASSLGITGAFRFDRPRHARVVSILIARKCDRPDRPDRTRSDPSDRDRPDRPGRLSRLCCVSI